MTENIKVVHTIQDVRTAIAQARKNGQTIGFVPTMGALHDGHGVLVDHAVTECDVVVVSIFVNPLQFGPQEDYDQYPRTLDDDVAFLRDRGADIVFAPSTKEMYPREQLTYVTVEHITDALCGAHRPGHFRGVTTVVTKLFHIVAPDAAYFGQKDAQQVAVIQRMTEDLCMPIDIRIVPTQREAGGLAMSSRNAYLTTEERKAATVLYRALQEGAATVHDGERDARRVIECMKNTLKEQPLAQIEYVAVVNAETLQPLERIAGNVLFAIAVHIGGTRLIDNISLQVAP